MSFTLTPGDAGKITFHVRYDGDRVPKDLWIYLLDPKNPDIAHATRLTGYIQIPPDRNPNTGFDIDYYPGAPFPLKDGRLAPGVYTFGLTWSFEGAPDETDPDKPSLTKGGEAEKKEWDWLVFWGKVAGSTAGGALSSALFNWWTGAAVLVCIVTGAIGGAGGSVIGQVLVHWLDAPRIRWTFRTSLLFNLFFTIAFSMVLGLLAIDLELSELAQADVFNRVTLGVVAVSALLASMLGGVLDNLRDEA